MGIYMPRRNLVPIVAFLAMATVSCSGGGEKAKGDSAQDAAKPPATIPTLSVVDPASGALPDYALPLDAYIATPEQIQQLANAGITLKNDCLQRFGFTGRLSLKPEAPDFLAKINAQRFGPTDAAEAKQWGYSAPNLKAPKTAPQATPLTPAEVALLGGEGPKQINGATVPEGGCAKEAEQKLNAGGPPPPADQDYARKVSSGLYDSVIQDKRFLDVQRTWSACMKTAGYTYADTNAATQDPAWSPGAVPSAREVQTALADVECKKQTNLPNVAIAVLTAYEQQSIEQHAEELTAYKAWLTNATRNASRVLAGR